MAVMNNIRHSDDEILIVSPDWGLRRNGSRTLLVDQDITQLRYTMLSPLDSLIVPLFNGKRTISEVSNTLATLLEIPNDQAAEKVRQSIAGLNASGEKLLPLKELGEKRFTSYSPEEFICGRDTRMHPRRLEQPLSLTIAPTHACQTTCRYCYAELRHIPKEKELTLKEWRALIDQARELGIERFSLIGGDIFAYPGILEILEHLISYDLDFFLSTKCHIDKKMARKLAEIGMGDRCIQFSMDAPERQTADFLTGSPGFFDRAVDSITNLLDNGLNVRCKGVLTAYNARMVPDLVRLWYGMGIRDIMFVDYSRSYYHHTDDLFIPAEESFRAEKQVRLLSEEFPDLTIIYGAQASSAAEGANRKEESEEKRWSKWDTRAGCSAGASSMLVWPDGLVTLCEQIPQTDDHIVGDVRKQSIMEIWNSERLLRYIYPDKEHFSGTACYDCERFDDCHRSSKHCFRDALFAYGNRYMPAPTCPLAPPAPRIF